MNRPDDVTKFLPAANPQFGHFHTSPMCVTFLQHWAWQSPGGLG